MSNNGKLLLVDDSKSERAAIKAALKGLFDRFIEVEDGLSAIKAFIDERPSFIITDVEMPGMDGYRVISTIRNVPDGADVPIILLSGSKQDLRSKLAGFNYGASDFLFKPYSPEELIARVKALLRISTLMQELKDKNLLLKKLATTDELTGLFNRRHFFDSVKDRLALGVRHRIRIGIMLMDIDHFKLINDTYGHAVGDEVLRKIGRLLNSCKREDEILGRFGGEEFILCLLNPDKDSAALAAERFRKLVATHDFASRMCPSLKVTISIGIAIAPEDKAVSVDEIIKAADGALYRSKAGGRDMVSFHDWNEEIEHL